MTKTIIYIIGAVSLHLTDFSSPNPIYSNLLPLIDVLFLIFLIWQLLFFFTLNNFSSGEQYGFFDLLGDIYDFRYDVIDHGWGAALYRLTLGLIELICFMLATVYYFSMAVDLIT